LKNALKFNLGLSFKLAKEAFASLGEMAGKGAADNVLIGGITDNLGLKNGIVGGLKTGTNSGAKNGCG